MSIRFERLQDFSAVSDAKNIFTTVIASLCDDARSELLMRACNSVRAMAGDLDYSIIVVANGPKVSPSVLDWLNARPDIHVVRLRSGSHPLARRVGAEMAESEFLAFLDDDDELIPNTLAPKIACFREHPEVDVLVTDGLRVDESTEARIFPSPEARCDDFVETLMRAGWGAGALTLRAQNVDLSVFDPELRHIEWTLTTLTLARTHQFAFLDEPMYRYYDDTPNSLSKTAAHSLAAPEIWRRLSTIYAGTRYTSVINRRYGTECHNAAQECVRQGKIRDAWHFHSETVRSPGGLVFLPFSARLLFASLRQSLVAPRSRSSEDRPLPNS
jgi:glycosyltransferase involved in cell wall biosynthesis